MLSIPNLPNIAIIQQTIGVPSPIESIFRFFNENNLSKVFSEIASYIFMFLLLPLIFLGSFPSDMKSTFMNSITPWLPTSMAIELIGVLFYSGQMPENAIFDFAGLFSYVFLISILSARNLRWRR